jgi:hypothetical protein
MKGKISFQFDAWRDPEVKEVKEVEEVEERMTGEIVVEGGVDLTQRAQRKSTEDTKKSTGRSACATRAAASGGNGNVVAGGEGDGETEGEEDAGGAG